jgi:hypothetical protein
MSTTPTTAEPTQGWTADDSTFGARLALIRQRMGWGNIARAAKECGVPTDSWRNWEVDGREPHRLTTIAMTIATKAGCDCLWLVHGPERGGTVRRSDYLGQRVITRVTPEWDRTIDPVGHRPPAGRSVRQTRPVVAAFNRPRTPAAV